MFFFIGEIGLILIIKNIGILGNQIGKHTSEPFPFVVHFDCRDKKKLDSTTRRLYRQGIACFDGNVPSYHLELREHPVMVWDFHSLMLTIRFLLSLSLTDTQNPLKMCEHCQKAFVAKQMDDRYCCEECKEENIR